MPFRHAWIVVAGFIGLTVLAFWPGYFSQVGSATNAGHVHAVTATLWMLLLVAQSWSIHHASRALHRTLGLAVFVAVPLFLIGAAGVIHSMARATASGQDPFYNIYGAALGTYDGLSFIAFAWFVAMALKSRRIVQLHARYMLATPLLLSGPVLARIIDHYVPGLTIHGPQDFHLFRWAIHLGALISIAVAAWYYSYDRRLGRPWLVAGAINLAQSILFETLGQAPVWKSAFTALATVPAAAMAAVGLALGLAALWSGWTAVPPRRAAPNIASAV